MWRVWVSRKQFFNPGRTVVLSGSTGHINKKTAPGFTPAPFFQKEGLSDSDARTIEERYRHREVFAILQFLLLQNTQSNLLTQAAATQSDRTNSEPRPSRGQKRYWLPVC